MYYVYIIRNNRTNRFYIGYTSDLKRRLNEHQKEDDVRLVYYRAYFGEKPARLRERRLKLYGSAWRALRKREE